ncbi:MAG: HD family hydrolase [Candidatus Micrarchaeota archaeon]|nr:HD family hydrolase [Candidatus Micrarchaeota archaeon]
MIDFFFSLGFLKKVHRTGWIKRGKVFPTDTVAAHSFRVAIIAYYLAKEVGVDPRKAALGGLVHDLHEYLTGDLDPVMKRYLKEDKEAIIRDVGLEGELREIWQAIYEKRDEDWVKVVKDADILETIIEGVEQGVDREFLDRLEQRLYYPISKRWAKEVRK